MISNLRKLDFQQINSFLSIVRCGSITAAASQLRIAKSAVSKQLSQLEALLGVKLLERSSRRLQLTKEGEHLLPYLETLLFEGESLLNLARDDQKRVKGKVRIAASPDFGTFLAKYFFPKVVAAYPELQLSMDLSYDLVDLQDPAFDLAFRCGNVSDERLVARKLGEFNRILVASPAYLAAHPLTHLSMLGQHQCLIFSSQCNRMVWDFISPKRPAEIQRTEVSGVVAIKSFQALLGLAEEGAGIARVPAFMALESLAANRVVRCLAPWVSTPMNIHVIHRFGAEKIQRVNAVLEAALMEVPALVEQAQASTVGLKGYSMKAREDICV